MTGLRRVRRSDAGETLIESLLSTFILAVAVMAILGAVLASASLASNHRVLAGTDATLKNVAEAVKAQGYAKNATSYPASASGYNVTATTQCPPAGAALTFTTAALASCALADNGLQLVTVTVTPTGGGSPESTQLMKRE